MDDAISSNQYRIRRAKESDVPHIIQMRMELESYLDTCNPNLWHVSPDQMNSIEQKYQESIFDSRYMILVVVDEETSEIIGMATGRIIHHEMFMHKITGKIDDVWIDTNHRHKGLCRRLIQEICIFFKHNGVKQLTLEYVSGNENAALVWQKMGFEPVIIIANGYIDSIKND
ncbi:MAG: GNAT family N-acetyltransferase [Eubacteriales bacterium]|nr:GNAT family N-acetyltransferase [Eubacteriales bacterium]